MIRKGLAIGIVMLFLISIVPYINGAFYIHNKKDSFADVQKEKYQQYMSDWSEHLINQNNTYEKDLPVLNNVEQGNGLYIEPKDSSTNSPMDSPWPMCLHDNHHTGQSTYSTKNNSGAEIWRIRGFGHGDIEGSAVIDKDGIIYFGTVGADGAFYALYPNGTIKWRYQFEGASQVWSVPAIAEDGTIYVPTWGGYPPYLYALYPNGTLKWTFGLYTTSSPAIADDGTIYIGDDNQYFHAINPDGTEKWQYTTGDFIQSSPAIANDGTIYVGSADTYLYAFYPNGTLRWRYKTGGWVKSNPSIGTDGTIFIPSFDGNLYALYPNGTLKWSIDAGNQVIPRAAAIGTDGTLYVGTEALRAFYPNNGTLKWVCEVGGQMYGTFPAISGDGTIYVSAGGSLVAVNSNGTEKWRKQLTIAQILTSPCIGPDDSVYSGSVEYWEFVGWLHAFGLAPLRAEAYGPYHGAITEPLQFTGEAFAGTPPYTSYQWDFGDGNTSNEQKPTHIYAHRGNYTATFTVTDNQGNQSQDIANVTIGYPLPKISIVKPQNAVYFFNIKILPWRYPVVFGPLLIKAEISQVEIGIDRVEFYDEGTLIKTDYTQPYDCLWRAHPPPILHAIMVRAYDIKGNQNSMTIYPNKWF